MSKAAALVAKPIVRIAELQTLTDDELWDAIGLLAPGAPVRTLYESELTRRASRATIQAAKSTKLSVIVATIAIVVAAAAQIGATILAG